MDRMVRTITPKLKKAEWDSSILKVQPWGLLPEDGCRLYIYRDVLEELRYAALQEPFQSCLLMGQYYIEEKHAFEFVEISGFRELIGHEGDCLEYAEHLRRYRGLLMGTKEELVVGVCHMRRDSFAKLSAQEAIFHRSFLNYSYQCSLILDAIHDACCTYVIDRAERLSDSGLFVISQLS